MTETRITSEVRLVSEVLYSGRFEVPWHQRYYDWKEEQVRDLQADLKDALDTDKTYYFLGSIMLVKPTETGPLRINDGQQRLITLSLLVAAFCRRFAYMRPRDQGRETLAMRALFDRPDNQTSRLDKASQYEPRIAPPRNDRSKFVQIIRGHDIGANGLLSAAWNVIDIFVEGMSRSAMADFFDFLMQRVEVSVLDIPGDVDANSVFEALNTRGQAAGRCRPDTEQIVFVLFGDRRFRAPGHGSRKSGGMRSSFCAHRGKRRSTSAATCNVGTAISRRSASTARPRLEIEKAASQRNASDHVFDLVAGLGRSDSIELFRTITSSRPSQSLEKRLSSVSGKQGLTVLLRELQGYKVSHPLVFALLHRFIVETDKDKKWRIGQVVDRSLKNLASFLMRTEFVAPKFEPSRFEVAFANSARNVFGAADFGSLDVMDELERNDEWKVIDDALFIRRMTDMEIRDVRKARRYLFGINAKEQGGSDILREDRCTIEHVLPESEAHWKDWTGFKDANAGDWVHRTGNLVVTSGRENRSGAEFNRSFAAKKRAFEDSPLLMPRTLAETYDEWTPKAVKIRSRNLAREAAATWQFSSAGRI